LIILNEQPYSQLGTMKRLALLVFTLTCVAAAQDATSIQAVKRHATPSVPESSSFDSDLQTVYYHGMPWETASRLSKSKGATERLMAILNDNDSRSSWENATTVLGFSGDPRAAKALVAFFVRDDSSPSHNGVATPEVDSGVYSAKANVPYALGLLLNLLDLGVKNLPNSPENSLRLQEIQEARAQILAFLTERSLPTEWAWRDVTWRAEVYGSSEVSALFLDLSIRCMEGLGVSGDAEALNRLNGLKTKHLAHLQANSGQGGVLPPYSLAWLGESGLATLTKAADAAIATNQQIGQQGLKQYYLKNAAE
jgi:hypothetical protein